MKKILLFIFLIPILSIGQNTITICDGDSALIFGNWETSAGVYTNGGQNTTLVINPLPIITPNFILNGNAQIQPGNVFQLTSANNGQSGSVWNNVQINLNNPFHFNIDIFLGCNNGGADGIAFVLQPVSTSIGSQGGGIGYAGISPSFAVEFDTWQNSSDPSYDHIAIQKNGVLNHNGGNNLAGPVGFPPSNYQIEDCQWHSAVFKWNPSSQTFTLDFDGYSNVLSYTGDIVTNIFGGNPVVYWGMTGATGGANNLQQFRFNYELNDTTICQNDSIQLNSLAIASSYTYQWSPSNSVSNDTASSPFFSPDTTTSYTLAITNSYGCTYVDSFTIYVDTSANISFPLSSQFCLGETPLILDFATPIGGNYLVNNNIANIFDPNLSNIGANTISYSFTSSNGCSNTLINTINVFDSPSASYTIINASCFGLSDGSIVTSISGGSPNYIEDWNGYNPLALNAGAYNYIITDNNNCVFSDSIYIFEPDLFTSSINTTDVNCFGQNDGSAIIQLQGNSTPIGNISSLNYCASAAGSDQYSTIENVELIGDNFNINNNTSGLCDLYEDYTTQYADITEGQTYTIDVTLGDCSGFSFSSGGKVYIDWNIDGDFLDPGEEIGTIPYGTNSNAAITFTVPNNGPFGVTRIRVVSQFLTSQTTNSITPCQVGLFNPPNYSEPWYGATEDYSIVVHSTTISATVLWSNGQTNDSINNLSPGSYTVDITNDNGCVISDSITINEPQLLFSNYSTEDVSCFGGNNGFATINIFGGIPDYNINFLGNNQQLVNGINIFNTDTILSYGTYIFSISDSNSCTITDSLIINEPNTLTSNYITNNVSCNGLSDGSATISINGGITDYNINVAGFNQNLTGGLNLFSIPPMLLAGDYPYSITDSNSCILNDTITINEPLVISVVDSINNVSCNGLSNGIAILNISGGTTPYTENWGANNPVALSAGSFFYTIVDDNGCIYNNAVTITEPDAISVNPIVSDVSCFSGNDGFSILNISGGVSPYTENWGAYDPAALSAGDYLYTVIDSNGCNYIDSITIIQPDQIIINSSVQDALCNGANDGSASLQIIGGIPPYIQDWGVNNPNSLSAGVYNFSVNDDNNCIIQGTVTVGESAAIQTIESNANVSCYGFSDGTSTLLISGGTAPYTNNWGANDPTSLSAGIYYYSVTDSLNCILNDSIIITEPTQLMVNELLTNVSCFGLSDGIAFLQISGGTAPYNEDWAGTNNLALSQGNYGYTITDNNGCVETDFINIYQPNPIILNVTVSDANCFNGNNGSIYVGVSGGTSPYSENWFGNDPLALSAGNYSFSITDDNGCRIDSSATVNQADQIFANYSAQSPICRDDKSTLSIKIIDPLVNQYSLVIDNQIYIVDSLGILIPEGIPIQLLPSSTVTTNLTSITDSDGCTSPANNSSTIVVNMPPALDILIDNVCESYPSFVLDQALPQGGTYLIDGQISNIFDIENLETGDYIITYLYTDPITNCSNSTDKIVSILPAPIANFTLGPQTTDIDNPNIFFLNKSEQVNSLIWNMGDGQTILDSISFNYTYSDTGKYIIELIISNQYGCGDTIQDSVIINPIYTCYIPNAFTPNDDGKNDSFGPVMTAMKSYSIRIYDRWGGIVFNEENKEWDGADYPKGIYNYNIEAIDYKNKVFRYAGKITLAR